MKKHYLIFAAAMALLIGSCSGSPGDKSGNKAGTILREKGNSEAGTGAEGSHGTIMLTKADFLAKVFDYEKNPSEWVYEGDKPCLIDFYADWCAPCRISSPILEELAREYKGKIHIYKINTEKEQELAMIFGIQGIPSFLFCPMEGRPTMSSGIAQTPEQTKQMFREQIDKILLQ